MIEMGVLSDAVIYNFLGSGHCKKGMLPSAKKVLFEMPDQNISLFTPRKSLGARQKSFEFMRQKGIKLTIRIPS